MGFIKNIFGAIFGIIGSILKGVLGIFGIGKKSEFYMELDEAATSSQPVEAPPAPSQTAAAPVSSQSTPEPVAETQPADPKPAEPAVSQAPASVPSFAANYLGGNSGVTMKRRRPGPSLSPFMDLARQVKAPSGAK